MRRDNREKKYDTKSLPTCPLSIMLNIAAIATILPASHLYLWGPFHSLSASPFCPTWKPYSPVTNSDQVSVCVPRPQELRDRCCVVSKQRDVWELRWVPKYFVSLALPSP